MSTNTTRRDFLTSAAAAGLAAATFGAAPAFAAQYNVPETWDDEADVVVVGGGGSGFSAAIEAANAGCDVLVLEKGTIFGGSTALCGQAIMGIGTSIQKAVGIEDSVEDAYNYFATIGDSREDLMRLILERSAETVEWLIGLGVQFPAEIGNPGLVYGGQEVSRADLADPIMRTHYSVKPEPGIWPVIEAAAMANPLIRGVLECQVAGLIQDAPGGTVLGVIDANGKTYRARRGVVLAAGGFARNPQMMNSLISRYKVQTTANAQDTGDGIRMGISAGAGTGYFGMLSNVQYSKPIFPCVYIVLGPDTMEGKPPFILVNVEGKRWSNERKFYSYICSDLLTQPEGMAYLITCGEMGYKGLGYAGEAAYSGETLEELAANMGVPPENLVATVAEWNAGCAAGVDAQFSRQTELYPLEAGPYYAAEVRPGCACTFGGINVDTQMHALAALDDTPIPHLYAAGVNTMALGRFYPTCGYAVAGALITGRVAGAAVASEEPTL